MLCIQFGDDSFAFGHSWRYEDDAAPSYGGHEIRRGDEPGCERVLPIFECLLDYEGETDRKKRALEACFIIVNPDGKYSVDKTN